jgi:predicted esterase
VTSPLRRFALLFALAIPAVLAGSTRRASADARAEVEERKQRGRVAAVWAEAAVWFKDHARKPELGRAIAEGLAASDVPEPWKDLEAAHAAMPDPEGEPDAATKERWAKAASDAAKAYEKLSGLPHDPKDDFRFDGYLLKAADLDPSKARLGKLAATVQQLAGNRARAVGAGRMLVRLRELDPSDAGQKRCDAIERDLATSDVALVQAKGHPMVGWLSLPKGAPGKDDRVLVCVDGSGANFLGAARAFRDGRGSRRFLVLSACALSCTNELKPETFPYYEKAVLEEWDGKRVDFDVPGLEALLDVVRSRYGAAEKVAITGFSGGGNLCYGLTMRRPARVWAAAPACANFNPGIAHGAEPVADGGPPVHVLTGEKDPHRDQVFGQTPGIEGQSDWAQEAFGKLGFTRVRRTMLPGVGHSSCVREVWAFLDEVAAGK